MPGFAQPPMRRFGDHDGVREGIFSNSLEAVKSLPAAENSRYRLEISEPGWASPADHSLAAHKAALLQGRTMARRLVGTYRLVDKASGAVADARRMTVAAVPVLSRQGTFVLDGSPQILAHQLRLDPAVYVRRKESGQTEAHVNVMPGEGVPHRLALDPQTGVFKVEVGQAEIPALALLKALGAKDEELKAAWGEELYARNAKAHKPQHAERLYEKFGPPGVVPQDPHERAKVLAERFARYRFDPWVMTQTLGHPHAGYDKDVVLKTTSKMLRVARGEAEPDDRDSLAYATVWGPEHLIAERLRRAGPLLSKALWAATNRGDLGALTPGLLTPAVRNAFLKSGLGQNPEGVGAPEFIDHGARITKTGEGGIGRSADSIPDSARNVSPSQFPFIDSIRTSESESVGVDLRVAFGNRLGADRRLYAPFKDVRTGKIVFKNPRDAASATVAFPGAFASDLPQIPAVQNGRLTWVSRDQVDYVVPSMEQSFSPLTNLIPFKSASKPHRSSMGSRMVTQALPLVAPEPPLVRTQVPGQPGKSFEELFGRHMGAAVSDHPSPGRVLEVTPEYIKVRHDDGTEKVHELYNNHPSGRMTRLHSFPVVKPGDPIAPGQLLARSNFTDDKGTAAFGVNARVAFMVGPHVYEDSVQVSRSLADRLTSEHLYRHHLPTDDHTKVGRTAYAAAFPGKFPLETLKAFGDDGVVKVGTTVKPGDPLILAVRNKPSPFGRLSRSAKSGLSDASELWEHDEPGVVTDVAHTPEGTTVTVQSIKKLQTGDKLSGLHGNKGVVVIRPDEEMPHDAEGKPVEAIFSSLGTVSRVNPSAILAAALGKVAAKTGRPYVVEDFKDGGNLGKFVEDELAKHGVSFLEDLVDPKTGRSIPKVGVGPVYVMKLHHLAEKKVKGRGLGGYDESGQPLRGQSGKALRASLGDTNAILGHSAPIVLHDAHMLRGQANDSFWQAYMSGYPVTRPTVSLPFERFLSELKAAGVHPVRENNRIHFLALTSADIRKLAGDREVRSGETVDLSRDGRPIPGGLFDPAVFGATDSQTTWGKVTLHEPIPSPVFEEPIRRLLGLTREKYRGVLAGRESIKTGTGPQAVAKALGQIDVARELDKTREQAAGSRRTARDEANRKLGYLKALAATGQKPSDWVLEAVPVMPPGYRPVSLGGPRGSAVVHDQNIVYSDLIGANDALKGLAGKVDDVGDERLNLYDAVAAAFGLGEPVVAKNRERGVKGVLERLLGSSSKFGYVQQKLLGTPTNLSGRGVAVPNPDLDLDQIGLPEKMAWEVYHPFVVRRLVRDGRPRAEAARAVAERAPDARKALLEEMDHRPVLATRYPALHKFNVQAFMPRLSASDAIELNHLITKSMAGDFDGDDQHATVIVALDSATVRRLTSPQDPYFWDYRRMTARFDVSLPFAESDALYCVRLEDFPRTEEYVTKGHIDFHQVPPGVRVVAYDELRNTPVLAEVSGWSVHRDRKVEIVTLLSGRQIITDDDPRAVYGIRPQTLELVRARPSEAVGLLVPRVDRYHDESCVVESVKLVDGADVRLSAEFGYFCGLMAGNGWVTHSYGRCAAVNLAASDPGIQAAFTAAYAAAWGRTPHVSIATRGADDPGGYGASRRLTVTDAAVARRLDPFFGGGARNKSLPPFFAAGDRAFRRGLLEGLLDTDGTVAVCNGKAKPQLVVNYSTASLRLAQEVQYLCRSLGIMATITTSDTPGGRDFWYVNMSSADVIRFDPHFRHTEKAARWKARPDVDLNAGPLLANHMVPFPGVLTDISRKIFGRAGLVAAGLYEALAKAKKFGRMPRPRAEAFIALADDKISHPLWPVFKRIVADTSTVWDAVVSYEVTERLETGYDLTVPGYETFMSLDGLILSNTYTVQVPLSDEAVREAKAKMLPSQNLFSPAEFKRPTFLPNMEYVLGLHTASTADEGNPPVEFRTKAEAVRAWREGKIGLGTRVRVTDG